MTIINKAHFSRERVATISAATNIPRDGEFSICRNPRGRRSETADNPLFLRTRRHEFFCCEFFVIGQLLTADSS